MDIDYGLAMLAAGRQMSFMSDDLSKSVVAEFLYDKCHYFTTIACDTLGVETVTLFYLSFSGRVVHSAVSVSDNVVFDVLGERSVDEISAYYDSSNSVTGLYLSEGACRSITLPLKSFDPNLYYGGSPTNFGELSKMVKDWIASLD